MRWVTTTGLGCAAMALGLLALPCSSQTVSGTQETRAYSYGIGRITWTLSTELPTVFAVPHWTAGARILCTGKKVECEIQVGPRDISVSNEERSKQMEAAATPYLEHATEKAVKVLTHGRDQGVTYTTLHDARPGQPFRYMTIGYAHRGPALIRFEAVANDTVDVVAILNLVHSARSVDALPMWALRLGDYKAACETRFPDYKAANDKAFASSPFAAVDLVQFMMQADSSLTQERIRESLAAARQNYAADFDKEPPARKQGFCQGFPRWVAEAARDLP